MKFNDDKIKEFKLIPPKKEWDKYPQDQLKMGIEVEKEHTKDEDIAVIIAANHLDEMDDYYTRLDEMEKGMNESFEWKVYRVLFEGLDGFKEPKEPKTNKGVGKKAYPTAKLTKASDGDWSNKSNVYADTKAIDEPYGTQMKGHGKGD